MLLNEKSKLSSMELEDSTRRIWWCGSGSGGGGDDDDGGNEKMAVLLRHHLSHDVIHVKYLFLNILC